MYATTDSRDTTVVFHIVIKATTSTVRVRLSGLVFVTSEYLGPVILVVEVVVAVRAWTHSELGLLELLVFFDDVCLNLLSVVLSPLKIMM